ncbi:Ankyrin [Lachnellula occidentalis]|uniref:Ankyrin n=1 Tax=Lachnellula occidentalis TaxID=215460 RepID=A0A8H8RGA2_9HELO|nr:Ankyrin [Lachnellula occidentalis]
MSSSESDEFEVIDQLEASLAPGDLRRLQEWLQPTDYDAQSGEFRRHLYSQAPGTGLWICQTSKYEQWQKSADHGSIWIKGVPGAGKSVTAASIIHHLRSTSTTPVLYFFFRHIISANRRPRCLVRDFLAQLLPHSTRLQAILQTLLGTTLEDLSDEILWQYLLTGLASIEKAYCVIDALDELELLPNDGFLERLNNLATFRPDAVKVLMTSRPKQYLQACLRGSSIVHVSLEDDLVSKDINLYLSHRLNSLIPRNDQQRLKESLISTVTERSRGLFLYARLLLDQIIPVLGSEQFDIETLAKSLPVGLEQMYNRMLFQQAESLKIDTRVQVFLLQWATHSSRALRLNELASVLASTFHPSMIPGNPKSVARSACAPLLEISEDETVQVIHHSFTEFLLNKERVQYEHPGQTAQFPVLDGERVHNKLSVACLDYLRSGALRLENNQNSQDDASCFNYQEAKLRYPFLEYAVANWAFHASKYDVEDEEFYQCVAEFLDPKSVDFRTWLELEWIGGQRSVEFQAPTPLHIAAFAGLTTYARTLIEGGVSVDLGDGEDRTPLHWACARGHTSMASLLLEGGANANAEDVRGVKPIFEAAKKNHATVVKLLLDAGVDPLTPKTRENHTMRITCGQVSTIGETAVEYAYLQGHTDTLIAILPFLTPEALEEMFCQCCRYGKVEAVRAILQNSNVSPNSKSRGATALYLACRVHSAHIVQLLLDRGADVHQTSKWRRPNRNGCGRRVHVEPVRAPIHGMVMGWKGANDIACQQILRLLVSAGANIEEKDADGDTPLLSLFPDGGNIYDEVSDRFAIKSLLLSGANVLAVAQNGDPLLHRCLAVKQDIQTLKLLFEHGVSADILGSSGNTTLHILLDLHYMPGRGQCAPEVIKFFLEMGARCDVKNEDGITAIEAATSNRHCSIETFTMLLSACSDTNAPKACLWKLKGDNYRLTFDENKERTVAFIKALQSFGVSLEDRDNSGRTVLLTTMSCKPTFEALIECGANYRNLVDAKGWGLLHHLVSKSHRTRIDDLMQKFVDMVDMGLDPLQTDFDGNTLLHLQAEFYTGTWTDNALIQKLFDYGISPNSKNKKGMTPLHVHLENKDMAPRNAVNMKLEERFQERLELPLLGIFQRSQEKVDINCQDADGVTILHLAAMRSEVLLLYLVEEGADPVILTKTDRNALHLACRARKSNVVGYLCKNYKMMINQRDCYGRTPLHDACTSGYRESVHHLLQAGANISLLDNNQRTPLHACAEFADEKRTWALLSRRNEVAGQSIQDRFRPVPKSQPRYEYKYQSNKSTSSIPENPSIGRIVDEVISAGCDPMANDSSYHTPLDLAIRYDCQEMVQSLKGSTELLRKKLRMEPENLTLQVMVAMKNPSFHNTNLPLLIRQQILRNPLTYIPFPTHDDIEWMIEQRTFTEDETNSRSSISGKTLFYIAVATGLADLVKTAWNGLATLNDDPEVVLKDIQDAPEGEDGLGLEIFAPALHMACSREFSNMGMIEALVEKCGININARCLTKKNEYWPIKDSVVGGTALHVLARGLQWWHIDALKYLLLKGADIHSVNEKGETPLHVACTRTTYADMNCSNTIYGFWSIECLHILLEHGADLNILDNDGLSCLNKASSSPRIMRILLQQGADINASKMSPLFSAVQIQCLDTLNILLDAGASLNAVDPHKDEKGFKLHYKVEVQVESRLVLFCASFSELHNQSAQDSRPLVQTLIERGANVYASISDNESLIHYTFKHADYEIVRVYLNCASKIDLNARDSRGRTVFLAGCDWKESVPGARHKNGSLKVPAPFLTTLELGADPLLICNESRNALHHLLDNPEMEEEPILQFLALPSAKKLIHQKDLKGFTPIHCALRTMRPTIVEALLELGASLLDPDPNGETALHHIAKQCLHMSPPGKRYARDYGPEYYDGLLSLWKRFLGLGGDINVRDNTGAPPLFAYLLAPQPKTWRDVESACCHTTTFPTYFSCEDMPLQAVDVHAKNNNGENALHIIARRQKSVKKSGGGGHNHDVEANKDEDEKEKHNKKMFDFFIGKGLNPLEEDGRGRSSLDVAAACGQDDILELFRYRK